jgi:hypothetical protein
VAKALPVSPVHAVLYPPAWASGPTEIGAIAIASAAKPVVIFFIAFLSSVLANHRQASVAARRAIGMDRVAGLRVGC